MYVLVDQGFGVVVDAGSGLVLEHLAEASVETLEWVLHTHHHRDQAWGTPLLRSRGARVAVPEHERPLFESAELHWQSRRIFDNYDLRNTFFTVAENIPVDAVLEDYETFEWRDYRFEILPAKGHTFGSSMLIAEIDGQRVAFVGDLLVAGGRLYQLHAMEYAYGELEGILFTLQSVQALRKCEVDLALPSHGPPIVDVVGDLARLERRLMDVVNLGEGIGVMGSLGPGRSGQETGTRLPATLFLGDPGFVRLSEHLLWSGPWTCSNFYVLLSNSRKALLIDYGHSYYAHLHIGPDHHGLETMRFVEHHLDRLREDHGIDRIDVVIPTHIHDDHTCGIPYLQRHEGTRCWALTQVGLILEDPAAWASTPCVFPKRIRIDRSLRDGEHFSWEEFSLTIYWAPGQTEFHSLVVADIDGRRVAFTGDNYFLTEVIAGTLVESSPMQTTVLRNSFQLAMHRRCAEVLSAAAPELICPGHRDVLQCSKRDIDRYVDFIVRKERVFRNLVHEPADHYIDLFWVRLVPYVAVVQPGEVIDYRLLLRNTFPEQIEFGARLLPPPGWTVSDGWGTVEIEPGGSAELSLRAQAPRQSDGIRRLLTAEVSVGGRSHGPLAEALVVVAGTVRSREPGA